VLPPVNRSTVAKPCGTCSDDVAALKLLWANVRTWSLGRKVLLALFALLCVAAALVLWPTRGRTPESVPPKRINTSAYRLEIERWQLPKGTKRPSLEISRNVLLLASHDGTLHRAPLPSPGRNAPVEWTELPFSIPVDMEIMEQKLGPRWGPALGVRDIFVKESPNGAADLYLLYGVYVSEGDCIITRVGLVAEFLHQGPAASIETIYDTAPCLPISGPVDRAGGRLAFRDGVILVTMGTPEDDKDPRDLGDPRTTLAQQWDSPFGKVLQVDPAGGAVTHLTAGHRNPQGLFVSADGRVWITDHGPRGGDELNLHREGANYGWPAVTYGTAYSAFTWPLSPQQGRHEGYERPIYSWVPSVGISQLVHLESADFGRWQGDLLITSLKGHTLYRTRVEEGRVIFAEPIHLGHRLRDIATADGSIYIVTDFDLLLRLEPDYARD
jgi:glucose/arabinose dehydrogenase